MPVKYKHTFFKEKIQDLLNPLLSLESNLKFSDYIDKSLFPLFNIIIGDDLAFFDRDAGNENILKHGKCNFYVSFFKAMQYDSEQAAALNAEIDKWVDYIENTLMILNFLYSLDIKNPLNSSQTIAKVTIESIDINLIERFYPDNQDNTIGIRITGIINYTRMNF